MSLYDDVKAAMRQAMLDRDRTAKDSISALRGELLLLEKDNTHGDVTDEDVVKLTKKLIKQRQEAIVQFTKGGRQDLVDIDEAQIAILKQFLPEAIDDSELKSIVDAVCTELKPESMKDMGKVMGATKGKIAATGKDVDGKLLADTVKAALMAL